MKTMLFFGAFFSLILPVFAQMNVDVDFNVERGALKALNGVNFGPSIYKEDAGYDMRKDFDALNVQSVRLHDVSLQNPGLKIVDTDLVFANFHADETDPRNFCFAPTDDYIKASTASGAKIIYRLGISIDHSYAKYRTAVPDAEKWAKICIKIIEHYNEGWANGFNLNIEYWEIWNEPSCKNPSGKKLMWAGSYEEFVDFYCKVALILKKRFPNLKIGGPSNVSISENLYKSFFSAVKAAGAPLDFYSWHNYPSSVEGIVSQPKKAREALDMYGFQKTELHLNEWHYFPIKWSDLRAQGTDKAAMYKRIGGIEAGVFATAVMTELQDTPIDVANYYTAGGDISWGLFDNNFSPKKSYYPFKAFGEIVKYPLRVSAKSGTKNVYVLAGKNSSGDGAVLVSLFGVEPSNLVLNFKGVNSDKLKSAKVFICDDSKNLEFADSVKIDGNSICLPINSKYSAVLVKF